MGEKVRKLQGIALDIAKTGDFIVDKDGKRWEKCVFTVELTNFSKRTLDEVVPKNVKGKKLKLIRYCCLDWHYNLGVRETLGSNETEALLAGEPTNTVYW